MEKILIALDKHETGDKIARVGLDLARKIGATIALLHVYPDSLAMDSNTVYDDYGIPDFTENMDWDCIFTEESLKFLQEVREKLTSPDSELLISSGDVAHEILAAALKWHADLIVVGSHSRRFLEDIFLGNTTVKVVRRSTIPTLIVPTREAEEHRQ